MTIELHLEEPDFARNLAARIAANLSGDYLSEGIEVNGFIVDETPTAWAYGPSGKKLYKVSGSANSEPRLMPEKHFSLEAREISEEILRIAAEQTRARY